MKENFIFGGCDTVALAKNYGTPLYVMDEEIIRQKCRIAKKVFVDKYKKARVVYASKAFLTMAMCKIIESEGLGLDVVSGGELYTAIKAGFPMNRVIFHGNNKTKEELKMAVEYGINRIVVDNQQELSMLKDIAQENNSMVHILFRIAPGIEGKTHKFISTGQKDSKFGIPLIEDELLDLVKQTIENPYIKLMGFHFHLGSQLFENDIYSSAIKLLMKLANLIKVNLHYDLEEINTGGGFGIAYSEGDHQVPLEYFTERIMEEVEECCKEYGISIPEVTIEPGRWIVGEAGITLYTIGTIKDIPGIRTYVSVDGGMPDNPRPALYGAKYQAIIANKVNQIKNQKVTVAGRCCETGDILIWDLLVPRVEAGDVLAIKNTGAYNYSMASNYNRLSRPAVVLVNKGRADIMVDRETYEDLLRNEKVPNHL